MAKPVVAQTSPYFADMVEGQSYKWCACGRSAMQPFCDGSHAGTEFEPVAYTAVATGSIMFCSCKATRKQPVCAGAHNRL